MKILELKDIGYRYSDALKEEFVLKNINYSFHTGKIYAIKGKSGSGKTTLLSIISGLEKPTLGTIYYENNDLSSINLDYYRSHHIGIIFQSFNLLPHLTAIENIILSMELSGTQVDDKNKKAIELLEKVGLSSKEGNRRVLKLSGGEQQRVAIARSLAYDAKIILADEPTGNLDHDTEKDIMDIFKKLANEGKCIIIVTHSSNVSKESDIVYELKKEGGKKK